jgi:hypothetical protein
MRPMRLRIGAIAAWFGVVALAFNALAPVRFVYGLAFGFVDARECGHYEGEAVAWQDPGWWALALLTGYDETRDPSHAHKGLHPAAGAICGVVGSLADFVPAAATVAPTPLRFAELGRSPAATENLSSGTIAAAYRSRAPPSRG